jgi:hypothetical protein
MVYSVTIGLAGTMSVTTRVYESAGLSESVLLPHSWHDAWSTMTLESMCSGLFLVVPLWASFLTCCDIFSGQQPVWHRRFWQPLPTGWFSGIAVPPLAACFQLQARSSACDSTPAPCTAGNNPAVPAPSLEVVKSQAERLSVRNVCPAGVRASKG